MRRILSVSAAVAATALLAAGCAVHGLPGMSHQPTEPGQGAFGALAEIVEILNRNPDTDWSKVNIDGLRAHLVDMNALALHAKVQTDISDNTIIHRVSGTGITRRAIQAMVPVHAQQLAQSLNWRSSSELTDDGVVLTVQAANATQLARLKALGFFGFMATGSHHQMHHLQMATGRGHHHSH